MLELPGVTLCCIDTVNHALALRALRASSQGIRFAAIRFITDRSLDEAGIEVRRIEPLRSRDEYSQFVLKSLLSHVDTPHVLLVQWDGYAVNPDAWRDDFLDVDYIGAKWFWHTDGMRVGNGGFSLRSRKLLEALQDPRVVLVEAEDVTIGRSARPLLEREHGIRYATEAQADAFAFEAAYPIGKPFGFHGLFNFCRVVAAGRAGRARRAFHSRHRALAAAGPARPQLPGHGRNGRRRKRSFAASSKPSRRTRPPPRGSPPHRPTRPRFPRSDATNLVRAAAASATSIATAPRVRPPPAAQRRRRPRRHPRSIRFASA